MPMHRVYRPYNAAATELSLLKTGCRRLIPEGSESFITLAAMLAAGESLGLFTQENKDLPSGGTKKHLQCRELSEQADYDDYLISKDKYVHHSFWAVPSNNFAY